MIKLYQPLKTFTDDEQKRAAVGAFFATEEVNILRVGIRTAASAFLRNNGNVLVMKRSQHKRIAPGMWAGVGGHMEPHELNNPSETCYREIEEETGITRDDIQSLELLYITVRMKNPDEIRYNYFYFGETTKTETIQTDEGILHWIPESELLNRDYTQTIAAMLEHYTTRHPHDRAVYVGVAGNDNNNLNMTWALLEDFE